jgi:hypothetical protein
MAHNVNANKAIWLVALMEEMEEFTTILLDVSGLLIFAISQCKNGQRGETLLQNC